MIRFLSIVLLLSSTALAQIELPKLPIVLQPDDPQPSKAISTIAKGVLYVVESSVPLVQLQSPKGFLSVVTAKGPLSIYGIFADGGPDLEMRQYTSPNILIVTGVVSGKTELILIPVGVTEESAIVRQVLTVSGVGPRPPPDPDPLPPPPPAVKSFRVIFVKESGSTLSSAQTAIPGAKVIREYLTARTTPEGGLAGWREYDPDQNTTNEQATMKALWAAVKPNVKTVPCLVIEANGKATVMPYPADTVDALKTLKEYGGQN